MTSYITLSDLESLNLSPNEPFEPLRGPLTTFPHSETIISRDHHLLSDSNNSSSCDNKRVKFCPLAVLIEVADEGQVELAMANAFKRDLGKKQISVKTYSLETPNFGNATSRAWNSVRNGLSATLEPLLSNGGSGSTVASTSRRRESSPERERYSKYEYKCPERTTRGGTTSRRRGSFSSWSTTSGDDEDEYDDDEQDSNFTPNGPTRLKLKIPTVKRRCSRPLTISQTSKSCLRRSPCSPCSSSSLPFSTSQSGLSTSPSSSKPLPVLSSSPLQDKPPLPIAHPQSATLIPVVDCCKSCIRATDYGRIATEQGGRGGGYVEKWSRGAKKLRAEQEKERKEREEWQTNSNKIKEEYNTNKTEETRGQQEGEEEEEEEESWEMIDGSKLGMKAKGVDELQMSKAHRHVKTLAEKEDAAAVAQVEGEEEERIANDDDESSSNRPTPPVDDSISPQSVDTTPLTSPDLFPPPPPPPPTASSTELLDSKFPFPSIPQSVSTRTEPSQQPQLERPSLEKTKRRSSSISKKVASFGSSFFGNHGNSSVQGVRF